MESSCHNALIKQDEAQVQKYGERGCLIRVHVCVDYVSLTNIGRVSCNTHQGWCGLRELFILSETDHNAV